MSRNFGRRSGKKSRGGYEKFKPTKEEVVNWLEGVLKPADIPSAVEAYVENPPKGFKIKELRILADIAGNPILRDFLVKRYPRDGSAPVDWQPPPPEPEPKSEEEKRQLRYKEDCQNTQHAIRLNKYFPPGPFSGPERNFNDRTMSRAHGSPLKENPNRANSGQNQQTLEKKENEDTGIFLDIKQDNSKAFLDRLNSGELDCNYVLPAVPRKGFTSDKRPFTLLECAIHYNAFNCALILSMQPALDLTLRGKNSYELPATRAFAGLDLSIGKMLLDNGAKEKGAIRSDILSYVLFNYTTWDNKNRKAKEFLETVQFLLKKEFRLRKEDIWKIWEKLESLIKEANETIDALVEILDAHRDQINEQIQRREVCRTENLLNGYMGLTDTVQKENARRIISAIITADRGDAENNISFVMQCPRLVDFLPAFLVKNESGSYPIEKRQITNVFAKFVRDFVNPGDDPKFVSEKRKFAEILLETGEVDFSGTIGTNGKNYFIMNNALMMREGDFDEFFEKVVFAMKKMDGDVVNSPIVRRRNEQGEHQENWLSAYFFLTKSRREGYGSRNQPRKFDKFSDIELERIKFLIDNGYDINRHPATSSGNLPIHFFSKAGDVLALDLFDDESLKQKNHDGWTPAHDACNARRFRFASALFLRNPELRNILNNDGKKPEDLSHDRQCQELLDIMIANGIETMTPNEWKQVEERAKASLKAKKEKEAAARGRKTSSVSLAPSFPRPDEKGDTANENEKSDEKIVEKADKEEKKGEDWELRKLARELCESILREVVDAAVTECEKKENEQVPSDAERVSQDPVVNSSSPDAPVAAAAPVHDVRASYRFDAEEEAACDKEVDKLLNSTAGSSETHEPSQLMASETNRDEPENDDEERDAPVEDAPVSEVDQKEAVVEEATAEESSVKEAPVEEQAPEPVVPVTQQTSRIWHRRRRGHFEARKLAQSRVDRQQTDQVNEEKEEAPPATEEPVQDASPLFSLDARSNSGSTIGSCQSLAGSSPAPSEITLSNISIKSASACDSIPASLMPYKMKQIALLESELAIALEKSKKYEKEAEGYKAELNKYIALYGPLPSDSTPRAFPSESNNSKS